MKKDNEEELKEELVEELKDSENVEKVIIEEIEVINETNGNSKKKNEKKIIEKKKTVIESKDGFLFKKIMYKIISTLIFFTFVLLIVWALSSQYKDKIGDLLNLNDKKENSTANVLGVFNKVNELYVYKENKASLYNYEDDVDKDKKLSCIVRYNINVKFNTKEIKVEEIREKDLLKGYKILLPKPIIDAKPKLGAGRTGDSLNSDTLGIEIIDTKGDFTLSEDDKIIKKYIEDYVKENKEDIESRAFEYTKDKLIKFAESANLKVLDVIIS